MLGWSTIILYLPQQNSKTYSVFTEFPDFPREESMINEDQSQVFPLYTLSHTYSHKFYNNHIYSICYILYLHFWKFQFIIWDLMLYNMLYIWNNWMGMLYVWVNLWVCEWLSALDREFRTQLLWKIKICSVNYLYNKIFVLEFPKATGWHVRFS